MSVCKEKICNAVRPRASVGVVSGIIASHLKDDPGALACVKAWKEESPGKTIDCLSDYPREYKDAADPRVGVMEEALVQHYWAAGDAIEQITAKVHTLPLYTVSDELRVFANGRLDKAALFEWADQYLRSMKRPPL